MKRAGAPRRVTRPGPGSDPAYLEAVRKRPCMVQQFVYAQRLRDLFCGGDVVAHHAGPKINDSTAVPLCVTHHSHWHDANGAFKGWNKCERRIWAEQAIAVTRGVLGWARTQTQGESR